MSLDIILEAATKRAAEEKAARKRNRPRQRMRGVKATIVEAEAAGVDLGDEVAVLCYVMRELGFDSAGFDAMTDVEVKRLMSTSSSVKQRLAAIKRERRS